MKLTLSPTDQIVDLDLEDDLVRARLWTGTSDTGVEVHALITRVAVPEEADHSAFERELEEATEPRVWVTDTDALHAVGRLRRGAGTFGDALLVLKAGKRVQRAGWNGRGMWIALTEGSVLEDPDLVQFTNLRGATAERARELARDIDDGVGPPVPMLVINAHIDLRAADGTLVIGWLASQTDMLADDWGVLS
jgi:hypothetical protein